VAKMRGLSISQVLPYKAPEEPAQADGEGTDNPDA
jgi:hypothetical protein